MNELRAKAKDHEESLGKYTDLEQYEQILQQVSPT